MNATETGELEQAVEELRINEREIYRQTLERKEERIHELEQEVRYLRDTLNTFAAIRTPMPQHVGAVRTLATTTVPRRWRI